MNEIAIVKKEIMEKEWAERYFLGVVVGLGHLVLRYLKVKKVDKKCSNPPQTTVKCGANGVFTPFEAIP